MLLLISFTSNQQLDFIKVLVVLYTITGGGSGTIQSVGFSLRVVSRG
ncbi:MAG: hypothetical protein KME52_04825 [Desmonostoc geniculatum HA4340-LM1]|jgi:hypothetical protein|nr:hypothetical protein [Desmonostoc geniculatum HA4340-LM1]